ncbi:hypothetical protein LINGRAPRIM_LOCUS3374 [Linum grandiflorum]
MAEIQTMKVNRKALKACLTCRICNKLLRQPTTISLCLHTCMSPFPCCLLCFLATINSLLYGFSRHVYDEILFLCLIHKNQMFFMRVFNFSWGKNIHKRPDNLLLFILCQFGFYADTIFASHGGHAIRRLRSDEISSTVKDFQRGNPPYDSPITSPLFLKFMLCLVRV